MTGVWLVLFISGCGGASATCSPVPLAADAERELPSVAEEVDFDLLPPCAFRSGFTVRRVFTDTLPGEPSWPRANFVVTRSGNEAFILSETRALQPFSAIPQSTHRLEAKADGVLAAGFAGPSGSGSDLAYLRWRVEGLTFELAGTLSPSLTERDIQAIGEALIGHAGSSTAAGDGANER
ncbi:MAG: hypothetical protein IT299_11065 [Dehalococcoidia bacterium]|nr:hypothetical protein [Dehalococcoidia bacterium]